VSPRFVIQAMPRTAKTFLVLGAFGALIGVALGAFGAHALKARLAPEMLAVWKTAVDYHFYHSLGLLAVGIIEALRRPSRLLSIAGWSMATGVILFSGSLYLLALTRLSWLGLITPLGGTAFLLGWGCMLAALLRSD
jgi:uncharacterized membrane protein YgdD (TMEM256/DUF423 family)